MSKLDDNSIAREFNDGSLKVVTFYVRLWWPAISCDQYSVLAFGVYRIMINKFYWHRTCEGVE